MPMFEDIPVGIGVIYEGERTRRRVGMSTMAEQAPSELANAFN